MTSKPNLAYSKSKEIKPLRPSFTAGTLVTIVKREYRYSIAKELLKKNKSIHKELESALSQIKPSSEYESKVPIEEVKIGDYVLSWNEKSNKNEYKKVTDTFTRTAELIVTA